MIIYSFHHQPLIYYNAKNKSNNNNRSKSISDLNPTRMKNSYGSSQIFLKSPIFEGKNEKESES